MRIDAHTQIGQAGGEGTGKALLSMLDEHGFDGAITMPGVSGLTGSPRKIAAANDYVAAVAKAHPDRLSGFATVNPLHEEEAWAEMERAARQGLRGMKLHPPLQGLVLSARKVMDPTFERVEALGWPVLIHAGLRVAGHPYVLVNLADIRSLAVSYPSVTIIVAHMAWGGRDSQGITDLARDCPNVWFETSGVNHPAQIQAMVSAGAVERLMYGSNYPFLHPQVEMLRIEMAELTSAAYQQVMGANAWRLMRGNNES